VESDPHLDAGLSRGVANRLRAADRARRPVERGDEALARRLHLAPSVALELATDGVVAVEAFPPCAVAHGGRAFGRQVRGTARRPG
jgi:hypothetical protein